MSEGFSLEFLKSAQTKPDEGVKCLPLPALETQPVKLGLVSEGTLATKLGV